MSSDKPHQTLAVVGHVDHGKNTFVGRLPSERGSVPEHVTGSARGGCGEGQEWLRVRPELGSLAVRHVGPIAAAGRALEVYAP